MIDRVCWDVGCGNSLCCARRGRSTHSYAATMCVRIDSRRGLEYLVEGREDISCCKARYTYLNRQTKVWIENAPGRQEMKSVV